MRGLRSTLLHDWRGIHKGRGDSTTAQPVQEMPPNNDACHLSQRYQSEMKSAFALSIIQGENPGEPASRT
jgi:hypothetical protein